MFKKTISVEILDNDTGKTKTIEITIREMTGGEAAACRQESTILDAVLISQGIPPEVVRLMPMSAIRKAFDFIWEMSGFAPLRKKSETPNDDPEKNSSGGAAA